MTEMNEFEKQAQELVSEFHNECADIAYSCEEEGLPSWGDTFDMRVSNTYNFYLEELEYISDKAEAAGYTIPVKYFNELLNYKQY